YDHVFVDTAGRNFREVQYIHELKTMLEVERTNIATYLVLSLTAKAQDTLDIFNQFKEIAIEKVIFTKMDETVAYGSIFNICLLEKMPLLYITNGQNVPEDLVTPNRELIIDLLLKEYSNE